MIRTNVTETARRNATAVRDNRYPAGISRRGFAGLAAGLLAPAVLAGMPGRVLAQDDAADKPADKPVQNAVMVVVKHIDLTGAVQDAMRSGRVSTATLAEGISDMVQRDLTRAGVPVVRRDLMRSILDEQRLRYESIVDPATAATAGKFVGARFVLLATVEGGTRRRIGETEFNTKIHYDVVDVQSATNVVVDEGKSFSEGKEKTNIFTDFRAIFDKPDQWRDSPFGHATAKASQGLSQKLAGAFRPTSWPVLGLDGQEVILEGGAQAGHKAGMKLEICHVRQVAGVPRTKLIATGEVTEVLPNRTVVKVLKLESTDAPVEVGYIARLPKPAAVAAK